MSVINQVLTQLEQRGAGPATEQTMVRAVVPQTSRNFAVPLLILGVVLIAVFAAWQSAPPRKQGVVAGNITHKQTIVPVSAPQSAVPGASAAAGETAQEAVPLPTSHPNAETGTVPSPSALHEVTNSAGKNNAGQLPIPACFEPCQQNGGSVARQPVTHGTGAAAQTIKKPDQRLSSKNAARGDGGGRGRSPSKAEQSHPTPVVAAAVPASNGALPAKRVSSAQQADAEFHKAVAFMQQGRIADAMEGYEAVLRLDPGHDVARRALVALLLEGKRSGDAERVLQEGVKFKPEHTGFAMLLARLQVERGAVEQATATLEKSLPYADAQADYHAFLAALLQRQNRHKEAITHYQIALQLVPDKGVWLMGYGISLQAVQRIEDARDAYRRALDSKTLGSELQSFVQQKLKSL